MLLRSEPHPDFLYCRYWELQRRVHPPRLGGVSRMGDGGHRNITGQPDCFMCLLVGHPVAEVAVLVLDRLCAAGIVDDGKVGVLL